MSVFLGAAACKILLIGLFSLCSIFSITFLILPVVIYSEVLVFSVI